MKHSLFSFILLAQLMLPSSAFAQRFEILKLSTPTIQIDGSVMKVGSRFSGNAKIAWTDRKQQMLVRDHEKGGYMTFVASSFMDKNKAQTPLQVVSSKRLSTADVEEIPTPQQQMLEVVKSKRIALIDLLLIEIDRLDTYESHGIDFISEYNACSNQVLEIEVNDMSVEQLSKHEKLLDKWNKRFSELKGLTE